MKATGLSAIALAAVMTACSDQTPKQEAPAVAPPETAAPVEPPREAPESRPAAEAPKPAPSESKPVGTAHTIVNGTKTNTDALILVDFKKRIDDYVDLHKDAAKNAEPLDETTNAAKISLGEADLAARIRLMRASAKPGDVFTPEIRDVFRRLMHPELKGEEGRDAKEILKEDAPKGVPLKVNAKYPEGASLPTVPVNILLNLPTLPKEVEYRIVGKDLILRDTSADIIVDYIPRAIQ